MRISRSLIAALAHPAVLSVGAVRKSSSRLHSRKANGNTHKITQSSSSLRRRLTPIRCDSVNNGVCYLESPMTVASDSTFSPSALLFEDNFIGDTVKSLVIQSTVECEAVFCLMKFQEFELVQIAGSVLASDIRIEVETFQVLQGGIVDGTARGYAAQQGPSPGYKEPYNPCSGEIPACTNSIFGAGHGGKGGYWAVEDALLAPGVYNSSTMPADFGSGGTASSGGGRIYIMATLKVEVDGTISEDGGGCTETTWCGSASGGSIYIASEEVLGTGYITANGGALAESSDVVASGGGGRIAIYSNAQSPGLTIDVSGGDINDQLPARAQGEQGTVYTSGLTSTSSDGYASGLSSTY